ncbi:hypothetical protein HDU76_013279 [Blyttiomyces sp. JEL0837]|nr:hypothetical protein HDU76_013279 [Blyttiomyces sp. JEL0837]
MGDSTIYPEGDTTNNGPTQIIFDIPNGIKYLTALNCCIYTILCIPCWSPYWSSKYIRSQSCTIDDKRIHYKVGFINKVDKLIPLDRIQDINIDEGCCARCFHVANLEIQTAGAGGGEEAGAEAKLIAPMGVADVRKIIIERRDKLVFGSGGGGGGAAGFVHVKETQPGMSPVMAADIHALKESVARIEKYVEVAVHKK